MYVSYLVHVHIWPAIHSDWEKFPGRWILYYYLMLTQLQNSVRCEHKALPRYQISFRLLHREHARLISTYIPMKFALKTHKWMVMLLISDWHIFTAHLSFLRAISKFLTTNMLVVPLVLHSQCTYQFTCTCMWNNTFNAL